MSASYALLGILARQPSYGYDLKRDYDFLYGKDKPLAFGQVYATLSRLLRDKKVSFNTTEQSAGPERKLYALTKFGKGDLESWLITPETLHPNAQTVLFMKVITAILLERNPDVYLDAQRTAHIKRMRHFTELKRQSDLAQSLQADYAIFHLEADLRWIDLTAARVQNLKQEILHAT